MKYKRNKNISKNSKMSAQNEKAYQPPSTTHKKNKKCHEDI